MAAAAVPAVIAGVGYLAKKMQKPPTATGVAAQAQGGILANAGALGTAGREQIQSGQGMVGQGLRNYNSAGGSLDAAQNYFQTITQGNRGAIAAAVAPQAAQISEVYSGAQRASQRSGIAGANKDVAGAELDRQRAGAISGLVMAQRPGAALSLAQIAQGRQQNALGLSGVGLGQQQLGVGALSGTTAPLSTVYNQQEALAREGRENQASTGKFFAQLIAQYIASRGGGGSGSGGGFTELHGMGG